MDSKVISLGVKISVSVVLALFLVGCSDEKVAKETQNVEPKTEVVKEVAAVAKASAAVQEKPSAQVAAPVEETVAPVAARSGQTIFQTCVSCHGINAQKAALNKSQIIQGWEAQKTSDALYGYKAGTYGGAMKGVMLGQVSKLSDEDIKMVSEYISKL